MSDETNIVQLGTEAHYRDAEYYDQAYRRRRQDVRFYADLAEQLGGPVLELGAGTGRVTLEIARRGIDVLGIDTMPEMLAQARHRAGKQPAWVQKHVQFRKGDIRRLRLEQTFKLACSPFNVFMHLYARRDVERALAVAHKHLRPGGRLAFDVLMPDLKALARDPDRLYKGRPVKLGGRTRRYSENFRYDAVAQVQLVSMIFQDAEDPHDVAVTPLAHRQFFPAELEALLHYNGFALEKRFGDFEGGPLREGSESQIVIARPRK